MATFLVTYGTGTGQTAKVARYVGSVLADRGHDVTTTNVWDASSEMVEDADAVAIGGPVYNRRHRPEVVDFVERNRDALSARPSAFFQLSFASVLPFASAREGAMEWVDDLSEETAWRPDQVALFAGSVAYTQYGWLTRQIFRLVSMATTGDTDPTRDYEYTDWSEVERFAVEFADFVEGRLVRARVTRGLGRRRRTVLGLISVGLAGALYLSARRRRREPEVTTGPAQTGLVKD